MSDYDYSRILRLAAIAVLYNNTDVNDPQFSFVAKRFDAAGRALTNKDLNLLGNFLPALQVLNASSLDS